MSSPQNLLEALAEIEHRQWRHWSQSAAGDVASVTRDKWRRNWIPYSELPEDVKEADRVWAREVIALLKAQKLIP